MLHCYTDLVQGYQCAVDRRDENRVKPICFSHLGGKVVIERCQEDTEMRTRVAGKLDFIVVTQVWTVLATQRKYNNSGLLNLESWLQARAKDLGVRQHPYPTTTK